MAAPDGASAKGEIQVRWGTHRFHGKTVTVLLATRPNASWSGSGRYDGAASYTYEVTIVDSGNGGGKNKTPIRSPSSSAMAVGRSCSAPRVQSEVGTSKSTEPAAWRRLHGARAP